MKVAGIIAEYNPFHNGHQYQIDEVRRQTGCDYVVVAMSGNFLQRGVPAFADKYTRTHMALLAGADLVIELPAIWSTASAEYFARAGVTLFQKMGNVTHLCFGAECGDLSLLSQIADVLVTNSAQFQHLLYEQLKKGASYPVARSHALMPLCKSMTAESIDDVLNSPNNILAIEYLKALKQTNTAVHAISPILIKREGEGYHSNSFNHSFASATALRSKLHSATPIEKLSQYLPETSIRVLKEYQKNWSFIEEDSISQMLGYCLLENVSLGYQDYADCGEDLANKIANHLYDYQGFDQFRELLKSKELTYTRISRALCHILLNIKTTDYKEGIDLDYIPYLRILGFSKSKSALLSDAKKKASVPLITKVADATKILSDRDYSFFCKDLYASQIYNQLLSISDKQIFPNDYIHPLCILP